MDLRITKILEKEKIRQSDHNYTGFMKNMS
jgi:hypothetical protein